MQSLRDIGAPFRKESQDKSDWNKVEFSKQKEGELQFLPSCSGHYAENWSVSQLDMYIRMRCRRVSWLMLFLFPILLYQEKRPHALQCPVAWSCLLALLLFYYSFKTRFCSPICYLEKPNTDFSSSAYVTLYGITWKKMLCNLYLIRKHLMSDCLYLREYSYQIESSIPESIPEHCTCWTVFYHSVKHSVTVFSFFSSWVKTSRQSSAG